MTCDPDAVDPLITVTLTWGGDDPGDLVLTPDCPDDDGMWWATLVLPDFAYRYTSAPPSAWVPGNVLLAVVPDSAALALTVGVKGSDTATLEAQKALLTAALAQWPYTVTVDQGGVTVGAWRADPTMPRWGALAQQDAGLFAAEAVVSIPVNPVGSP